jgi:glutathione S-transferase
MITLCGFAVSNYFNVVKQVLLEKQIPYTEERTMTRSKDEAVLSASPLGKVPFIRTAQGPLCETPVILDYLEAQFPAHPLLPADAFAAAKVRELCTFINLHLELQPFAGREATAVPRYIIYLWAETYNIFRVYGGRAGMMFAY